MKSKSIRAAAVALLICVPVVSAQEQPPPTEARRPLARLQEEFVNLKFGMFMHFNIATFNNREWANGYEDPATFAPDKLDCGQWADAAKSAGMRYGVLTVKHTGGWCLWDSDHTTGQSHQIESSLMR